MNLFVHAQYLLCGVLSEEILCKNDYITLKVVQHTLKIF